MQVAKGKDLYEKQCKECHGANGEGDKAKFYPVIAGQHYKYLLRQMTEIRDGHRRNANPDMVKVIKPYTDDQLVAISAYQASLKMPGSMCSDKKCRLRPPAFDSHRGARRARALWLPTPPPRPELEMSATQNKNGLIAGLTFVALVAMVAAYFSPIWWVSLTAPNYPEDAFPDGIRIHFHFDGVKNGCSTPPKTSRLAEETMAEDMGEGTGRYNPILAEQDTLSGKATALDCVHEMNTINHYVGMFPIATGAPVEKPSSPSSSSASSP